MPYPPVPRTPDSLKGFELPPVPEPLRIVREEHGKSRPDLEVLTRAIVQDAHLAAEILKVVNSPAFGLRRTISSIPEAIVALGLANISNLVSGIALRAALSAIAQRHLDRFWDTANDVAFIGARIAAEYSVLSPDAAYTLGLFHDCGIPLLLARHGNYGFLIKRAVNDGWKITDAETHYFQNDHATLGFHIARHWNLPQEIAQAILYHHQYPAVLFQSGVSEEVRALISVLKLSEHVSNGYRSQQFDRGELDREWAVVQEHVLDHLAIGDLEFVSLRDELIDMLSKREKATGRGEGFSLFGR